MSRYEDELFLNHSLAVVSTVPTWVLYCTVANYYCTGEYLHLVQSADSSHMCQISGRSDSPPAHAGHTPHKSLLSACLILWLAVIPV